MDLLFKMGGLIIVNMIIRSHFIYGQPEHKCAVLDFKLVPTAGKRYGKQGKDEQKFNRREDSVMHGEDLLFCGLRQPAITEKGRT
ncbi:hypothetical protein D3C75_776040 [compost metagenome]